MNNNKKEKAPPLLTPSATSASRYLRGQAPFYAFLRIGLNADQGALSLVVYRTNEIFPLGKSYYQGGSRMCCYCKVPEICSSFCSSCRGCD